MKLKLFAFLFSLISVITGCDLSPKYTRPDAPVPENFPSGTAYKNFSEYEKTDDVPNIKWQDYFLDVKIQKIIKMALENNRNLRIAALNVELAKAKYNIQRSQLLPTVGVTGTMTRTHTPADLSARGRATTSSKYSVEAGISSWEIDFFGRIRNLSKQEFETYLATGQGQRSTQIALIKSVVQAYLALAADMDNLNLAQLTLESRKHTNQLTKNRYDIEIVSKLDLTQTQREVNSAEKDVAYYTQLIAQDINALNLLVGKAVPKELFPQGLNDIGFFRRLIPNLSSKVLLNRPDILQAEHNLKAANAYIGAARAACFPNITLTTSIGTASTELTNLFSGPQGTWTFMPQINIPIFNPSVWIEVKVSKVQKKIALAEYELAIQTAFKEVSDTLAEFGMIDKRIAEQIDYINNTQETYELSDQRYLKGIENYLTVLEAQRSIYSARQTMITLYLTKLNNLVNLYTVLGGGGILEKKDKMKKND